MSLPVFRQQDSSQIRMSIEYHTKQIVRFPLVPVSSAPNTGNAVYMDIVFIQQHLQTPTMVFCRREQMIVDFEARLFFDPPIYATKVRQEIKACFGVFL